MRSPIASARRRAKSHLRGSCADGIIAIPKAGTLAHTRENRAALDLHLSAADFAALDGAFPPPKGPGPARRPYSYHGGL